MDAEHEVNMLRLDVERLEGEILSLRKEKDDLVSYIDQSISDIREEVQSLQP